MPQCPNATIEVMAPPTRKSKDPDAASFTVTANGPLIKQFKMHCMDKDLPIYEEFETAVREYLAKRTRTAKMVSGPRREPVATVEDVRTELEQLLSKVKKDNE